MRWFQLALTGSKSPKLVVPAGFCDVIWTLTAQRPGCCAWFIKYVWSALPGTDVPAKVTLTPLGRPELRTVASHLVACRESSLGVPGRACVPETEARTATAMRVREDIGD